MHKIGKVFITLIVLAALVVGGYFLGLESGVIWKEDVDFTKYPVRGISVSEENGEIDWLKVKNEGTVSFALIRATKGTMTKDKNYATNYVAALKNGISVGIYHEYVHGNSLETQAKFYKNTVKVSGAKLKPTWKIMFDHTLMTEDEKAVFQNEMYTVCQTINSHFKKNLMIYTTEELYKDIFSGSKFDNNNLVVENLKIKPLMMDASRWHFWQYKTDGAVPGISTPTCKLVYTNTPEDFQNYMAHTK